MEEVCSKENTIGRFLASILPYSPRHAQKSWMRINAFILAWTILSFIEILRTLEPENRLNGTRSYLIYNTTVCFIWTIECGLHLLEYQHRKHFAHVQLCGSNFPPEKDDDDNDDITVTSTNTAKDNEDKCEIYLIIIELMLAAYYLYDAVVTFSVLWQYPNFNIGTELFDVLLDMVAYTYLTVRLSVYTQNMNKNEDKTIAVSSNSSTPKGEAMDYVGMKDPGDETAV